MIFYLTKDINSNNKKKTYAVKGEKVTKISDHGNVFVVESIESGERFGVNVSSLSESHIPKEIQIENKKTKK